MITNFDSYNSELFLIIIIDAFMEQRTPQFMWQQVAQYL